MGALAGWIAREALHQYEKHRWDVERSDLLNRIQAPGAAAQRAAAEGIITRAIHQGPDGKAGVIARREGISPDSLRPPFPNIDM